MPILAPQVPKPLTAWSASRLSDYETCAYRFYRKHILGIKEPGSAAMDRGTRIHKLAEQFVKNELKELPQELKLFHVEFEQLKARKIKFIEENWAVDKNWSPVDWFSKDAWLRVKLDAAYAIPEHSVLTIVDHKTGKFSNYSAAKYEDTLNLYGVAGLAMQPEIKIVSPRLWFIDAGLIHPDPEVREIEIVRKDEKPLRKKWEKRVVKMFADTSFKPQPSSACKFCMFRRSAGGDCPTNN